MKPFVGLSGLSRLSHANSGVIFPIVPDLFNAHAFSDEVADRIAALSAALAEKEAVVRDEHARAGVPFVGIERVRRQHWKDRPSTSEPRR